MSVGAHGARVDVHAEAERLLRSIDQRYSDGRRRLVEILAASPHPLIATDIADEHLPQSSVYRNLTVLEQAGVVSKVLTNGERAAFELAERLKGHHHHLVCLGCGQVVDIDLPADIERRLTDDMASTARRAGFVLEGHRLDLIGRCTACASTV